MTKEAPEQLRTMQDWFAQMITQPMNRNSVLEPVTLFGTPLEVEAARYIAPNNRLSSGQRIELYHQQFWWRILGVLHEQFPMLVRLEGYCRFNEEIAIPYIQECFPNHWSLSHLGDRLPDWVIQRFPEESLWQEAAALDWAYQRAFHAPFASPFGVEGNAPEQLFQQHVLLQPHMTLFTLPYKGFFYRKELLQATPQNEKGEVFLPKTGEIVHALLFRDRLNYLVEEVVSREEMFLLKVLQQGCSIEQLIENVEKESEAFYTIVAANLKQWMQKWIENQWLTQNKKHL